MGCTSSVPSVVEKEKRVVTIVTGDIGDQMSGEQLGESSRREDKEPLFTTHVVQTHVNTNRNHSNEENEQSVRVLDVLDSDMMEIPKINMNEFHSTQNDKFGFDNDNTKCEIANIANEFLSKLVKQNSLTDGKNLTSLNNNMETLTEKCALRKLRNNESIESEDIGLVLEDLDSNDVTNGNSQELLAIDVSNKEPGEDELLPTRWEALADVVAELPPRLTMDPTTGQIFAITASRN